MRIGFLSSAMALLTGMSTALGQPPATPPSDPAPRTAPAPADSPPPDSMAVPESGEPDFPVTNGRDGIGNAVLDNRYYGKAEYLIWKFKDAPQPPLQLTLPLTQSGFDNFQNNVLLPGTAIQYNGRSGARFTLGFWADEDHDLGVEGTFFIFDQKQESFNVNQVANPTITITVQQNVVTTFPGPPVVTTQEQIPIDIILPGQLTVNTIGRAGPTQFLGGEINARSTRGYFGGMIWDFIAGVRYLSLEENFTVNETINLTLANPSTIFVNGLVPPGFVPTIPTLTGTSVFTTSSNNQISTRNQFYGAQVGTSFEWWLAPRVLFTGWGKLGVGGMLETVRLDSVTSTVSGATVTAGPGGLLGPVVGNVNSSHVKYAVIPEFNINFGYQVTRNIRTLIGYNFMYVTTVARPGDQISFSSSTTQFTIAGTQSSSGNVLQPNFTYKDTDFYVQGLTTGIELRW